MDEPHKTQLVIAMVDFMRSLETPTLSYQALELLSNGALAELRDALIVVARGRVTEARAKL